MRRYDDETMRRGMVAIALVLLAGCDEQPGEFDPFEVTVVVHGAGNGSGVVGEIEAALDITCHIVAG
ncbi:MAG TPA: hypothetical protein VJU15_04665, partial [Gemmatimonadales bacterium]|nr:hypothetical protein [Gemmatimonadales bacterium]